ncbi:MAG: rhomboid family intramembrane serine protease [Verrucomicrobiota bacterium]
MVYLWILLSVLVTFLFQIGGVYFYHRDPILDRYLCLAWGNLLAQPERLLLYGWLHSTLAPWHVLLNGIGIFYLGRDVEKENGPWKTLLIFVGGVIAGGLLWKILPGIGTYPKWRLMGCSAGVCALFAVDTLNHQRRNESFRWGSIVLSGRTFLFIALGFEIVFWRMGWWGFIAHTAHLGGILAGILIDQLFHFSETSKKIVFFINSFWNASRFFMKRNKIILVSVINCLIVAYLGYLVWKLNKPLLHPAPPAASVKMDSPEVLVQKALRTETFKTGTFQDRIKFLESIPPHSPFHQIEPLLSCLNLQWKGYNSFSLLEKFQWFSTSTNLLNQSPEARVTLAQGLEPNIGDPHIPLLIQTQSYISLGNVLIAHLTDLSKSKEDPTLTTETQTIQTIFERVNLKLEKQKNVALIPIQMQAKAFLRSHYPDRFPYPTLERELTERIISSKSPEKIKIEALKALTAIQSPAAIHDSLPLLSQNPGSTLQVELFHYLSSQGDAESIRVLSQLQPIFPDEEEIILRTIQSIRDRHKPAPQKP